MNKFVWRLGLTLVVVLALFGRFSSGAAGEKTMSSQMLIIDDPPPGGGSNTTDVNCAALSDPSRKGLFSLGLMERMAVQCGVYSAPVGSGDPYSERGQSSPDELGSTDGAVPPRQAGFRGDRPLRPK